MKFIASLVFVCFSSVNVFLPAVAFASTMSYVPVALPDSNNPAINVGYEPSVPVLASTTWQKSYEQNVGMSASDAIRTIAAKNISDLIRGCPTLKSSMYESCANPIKNNTLKVAIYLVPTYSFVPPTKTTLANCGSDAISYVYDTKKNKGACLQYPSITGNGLINPSFSLYAPTINNYGYFVGYADYTYSSKGGDKVVPINNSTSTLIGPMGFAWLPVGTYKVYTAVGYSTSTLDTAAKNVPVTLTSLLNNSGSVFPIMTPEVAYSQLPSPIVYKHTLFTPKSEPYYPTSISPLPQSVSRNVLISYNSTAKTVSNASAIESDIVLGAISTSTVTITPAPDPEMIITSPFGDNIIWQKGVNHDITWIANFRRSNDNDTGIHTWDGITVVRPYGYWLTYNHGGTVDEYNSGGAIAGRIVLDFIPVVGQVIGLVLSILDLFGVFDDTTAPFAVTQVVTITPFSTSTNSYTGSPYLLANTFVENAKVTVSLANIPNGVYVLQAKALVGTTNVIATSSPFTLISGGAATTGISTSSLSTTLIVASTSPIISTTTITTSTGSSTRIISPIASTTVIRPISPVATTTTPRLTPFVQNSPVQNRPNTVSVPATIDHYTCPTNYILTQNSLCRIMSSAGQPRQHSFATTSQQATIPATPIYICPNSFNLNTANNTCTKPVSYQIQDVPQESMMANVINTFDTMMRILSL